MFNFLVVVAVLSSMLSVLSLPLRAQAKARECRALFDASTLRFPEHGELYGFSPGSARVDDRVVYFQHLAAREGKGTTFLFSGLFTPISEFAKFREAFAKHSKGEGLVIMSYDSMPDSLAVAVESGMVKRRSDERVNLNDMVRDATAVVNAVAPKGPVAVAGYSYGSAPAVKFAAFHRERISDLIFIAPLVFNGEHSTIVQNGISAMSAAAFFNPWLGSIMVEAGREQLAHAAAQQFVTLLFASERLPKGVSRGAIVSGIAGRIRATENFDLRREDFLQLPRSHFVFPEKEDAHRLSYQKEVVEAAIAAADGVLRLPTVTNIAGGDHVVIGSNPVESAKAIIAIMRSRERSAH